MKTLPATKRCRYGLGIVNAFFDALPAPWVGLFCMAAIIALLLWAMAPRK
jgi:hypothetical protein